MLRIFPFQFFPTSFAFSPTVGQEWLLGRLIVDINRTEMIRLTFIMFFSAVVDLKKSRKGAVNIFRGLHVILSVFNFQKKK